MMKHTYFDSENAGRYMKRLERRVIGYIDISIVLAYLGLPIHRLMAVGRRVVVDVVKISGSESRAPVDEEIAQDLWKM